MYEKMYDDLSKKQSLFNEAQGLIEFLMKLEDRGKISDLVFESVVDPLVSTFQMHTADAQKSN